MKEKKENLLIRFWKSRPALLVLLICLFEFLGLLAIPSAVFSEDSVAIGLWYQIYIALTACLSASIVYLLWRMKKSGVVVYFGSYAIHNIIALIAGNWMMGVIIIPVIGGIFILLSWKRFNARV